MKILVTGSAGQVGHALQRTLAPLGEVVALDRQQLDLSQSAQIRETVHKIRPQIIVNAAAYTAVDKAEREPELAQQVNGFALEILAQTALEVGAGLIHYSTDYVFAGTKTSPYTEADPTEPLGVYGRTKLWGEVAIQKSGVPHLILRTSWVYGLWGKNFLLTMLRLAREREELRVVADQTGAPTTAEVLASQTAQVLALAQGNPGEFLREKGGLYHLGCGGQTTWYEFTLALLAQFPEAGRKVKIITPITTAEYPTPAQRPAYSVLGHSKYSATFGLAVPTWQAALADLGTHI